MARVTVEIADHVARVTLARPEKLNAVDPEMLEAIIAAGSEVDRDDVRAVVLAGEGRAFCAGLDFASFAAMGGLDPREMVLPRTHGDTNRWQQAAMVWHRLPVPVIAALHGQVYGAGLQIAAGADIRIAAPDAELAVMEMKWGLVPDMGGMVLLPRLVRSDVLRRLTYTARPVGGDEALALGLVTELAEDPAAAAQALAHEVAGRSPSAVRAAKRLIAVAESGVEAAEVLMAESREQAGLIGGADQMEAVAANLARRPPRFE
ncbi:crotonase/enoyl-CoA hydratase family protein [Rhodosalinus halophilus]|uniref:Crotonase/enoyl-CoA hydratase family protein n=1 Tax=Rhodosalinus halophilus TaxID=2259333 RepID=A0A365U5J0_9RHOB|nr:crotonase/enoyl-CoA hydratase family protein [Rhodosalinus halophilus]RBI83393.1 crotonase/enoyl-CoA hydratase family protein [Rhodosalinus halophilus]